MAEAQPSLPAIHFRTPTFQPSETGQASLVTDDLNEATRENDRLKPADANLSAHDTPRDSRPGSSSGHDVYLGSYRRPRSLRANPSGDNTPRGSIAPSSHGSKSQVQLAHLLDQLDVEQETYGVEEHRDGFFDALFLSARLPHISDLLDGSTEEEDSSSAATIVRRNIEEIRYFLRRISTTRAGIKLIKTCLPFFIAYFICLIPAARDWLGRYNFVMPLSAILNHSGRPVGAQVDGALLTIAGTVAGLSWGALALYVSTSTSVARSGYGGVLAAFLVVFTAVISYLRCVLIRFYQFVICAGIAVVYTTLADTSETVGWRKLFDYGIPFVLGQAISLLVCLTIFPDAGSRAIAVAIHRSMTDIHTALQLPRKDEADTRKRLASAFVNLSDAVRDFTIDFSITRFYPDDIKEVRNLGQAVIRNAMALESTSSWVEMQDIARSPGGDKNRSHEHAAGDELDLNTTHDAMIAVSSVLAAPVGALLLSSKEVVSCADNAVLTISGYRPYIEPVGGIGRTLSAAASGLHTAIQAFDEADTTLLETEQLPLDYAENPELVNILVFVHSVRQVANSVQAFAVRVLEMESRNAGVHVNLPSYPFVKSMNRTNAQVRHDRGGLTVGFYFRTKRQLERTMRDLQSRVFVPLPEQHFNGVNAREFQVDPEDRYNDEKVYLESRTSGGRLQQTKRYKIWLFLRQLQGFETRFALKVMIVTTLLSIPAWLPSSRGWWNENESWFAIVLVWVMMHPRVGGNLQDLFTRDLAAAIGAIWAGFAYAAANGNPYVMAVFAVILMVPMLYRFTQSTHPRSGLAGCMSFTLISLSAYTDADIRVGGLVQFTWTRGVASIVGITSAVVVNWVIWPFVARHELRKSVSTMLLHLAIIYRGVVSKYVYFLNEGTPNATDIERSEMLEGRLREAFVRIRQLLELTNHEIRLRAPFDSRPYRVMIDSCESVFNDLIKIRQFSLYFQPILGQSDAAANAALLSYRRDAVASILMVMYTLAGALKTGRPLPRYLPSAAAARKRLLDRMSELYGIKATHGEGGNERRWADVYQYAYSKTLTDIVEQLHHLQQTTKLITGEVGFDHDG
jgi:Fusaric acid resistance protein-like/Putative ER transporter, 6TM, N-terminal